MILHGRKEKQQVLGQTKCQNTKLSQQVLLVMIV